MAKRKNIITDDDDIVGVRLSLGGRGSCHFQDDVV
ncbi:hypothetical protein A2U01_0086077, partial [Trifolium medium]|nr:hypothetical protein [Trifolium medium]